MISNRVSARSGPAPASPTRRGPCVWAGGFGVTPLRSRDADYEAGTGNLLALHVTTGSAGTATTDFVYDDFGNVETVTFPENAAGQRQHYTYTYDATVHTHVVGTTDAFGDTSTAAYDLRFGVPTTTTDLNGQALVRAYDDFGRLTTVRGPYDGAAPAVEMTYLPDAVPPRAITVNRASPPPTYTGPAPGDVTTVSCADGLGRPIEMRKTAAVGGVTGMTTAGTVAFDAVGRVASRFHPFFTASTSTICVVPTVTPATTFAYDVLDRAVSTTAPDGSVTLVTHAVAPVPGGASSLRATLTDPNGHVREVYRDLAGRIAAVAEHPDAATAALTAYGYLPTGELASIVDAAGNTTTLTYDLRGLWTSMANPDTGLIELSYDAAGNVVERVEPNHRPGPGVRYTYEFDRLVAVNYPSKTDVSYRYGLPGEPFNRAGRVVTVTDETGTEERFYGALGETTRTLRTVNVHAPGRDPLVFDTGFVYDSLGRMLRLDYPDGEVLTYAYDAGGLLASATGAGAGWTRTYVSDLRYDVFGNRTHALFGNGVVSDWTFDPLMERLSGASTVLPSGDPLQALAYAYDPGGNPIGIASTLPPVTPGGELPGPGAWAFSYDGVDRLVTAHG
ncbi:MAG TPA: hypothetical protein VG389_27815, partial [Myxococcota bacterium]|nr:hypothetical protein [Myxococcota bacterium]